MNDAMASLPVLALLLAALCDRLVGTRYPGKPRLWISLTGTAIAVLSVLCLHSREDYGVHPLAADGLSVPAMLGVLFGLSIILLWELGLDMAQDASEGDSAILLLSAAGMILMCAANSLLILVLGAELATVLCWVRVGSSGRRRLIACFLSAALLLLGLAAVNSGGPLLRAGLLAFGASIVTRLLAVQSASAGSRMMAFIPVGLEVSALSALARVLISRLHDLEPVWVPLAAPLSCALLLIGSLIAILRRDDLHALLAGARLHQAGLILLGILSSLYSGVAGLALLMAVYPPMTIGLLRVAHDLRRWGVDADIRGLPDLAAAHPPPAALVSILTLGTAGIPMTSGFFARFFSLYGGLQAGYLLVAAVAAIAWICAVYTHLRLVAHMHFVSSRGIGLPCVFPAGAMLGLVLAAMVTIVSGIYPAWITSIAGSIALR